MFEAHFPSCLLVSLHEPTVSGRSKLRVRLASKIFQLYFSHDRELVGDVSIQSLIITHQGEHSKLSYTGYCVAQE